MNPKKQKNGVSEDIETFIGGALLALVVIVIIFGVLNYFNIISLSSIYKSFSRLPHAVNKTVSLPTGNITAIPKLIDLCKPFLNNHSKTSCQEAVKIALTDTKGVLKNISTGPLELTPALEKIKDIPKNQQMWLIDIALTKFIKTLNGKVVKSLRVEVPVDGTKTLYRIPINS